MANAGAEVSGVVFGEGCKQSGSASARVALAPRPNLALTWSRHKRGGLTSFCWVRTENCYMDTVFF